MSNTQAALKAAKEVQADVLAPELYRQATEWFLKARQEYRYKDFEKANDYAFRARQLSEQAEFEALKNGGIRGGNPETLVDEPVPPPSPPAQKPNAAPGLGPQGDLVPEKPPAYEKPALPPSPPADTPPPQP